MIRHWPDSEKIIWTDYVFQHCRERIACRLIFDRSTCILRMIVCTDGNFVVDEINGRVVI